MSPKEKASVTLSPPEPAMRVPYVDLVLQHQAIKPQLLAAVEQVIDSGQFVLGPQVAEFEKQFAQQCGVRFAIGVANGTDALVLALKALGIGPGDQVITAPNSFVASASCIALVGATPRFVDVRDDMNMDPGKIQAAITPQTKAILPVHLTGRPADMDAINAIARKHHLFVIEDAAQAVLAQRHNQRVGSFGDLGCFSLHPLKTLNALGDGGIITTNNPDLDQRLRILRNLGLRTREQCVQWSGNSRLDTIQAAMLLVKLKYLHIWTDARRAHAHAYRQALSCVREILLPNDGPGERCVYHTFIIQAPRRNELKSFLEARGIQTAIHYPIPIHLQETAKELGLPCGSFPVAEKQAETILSLPIYPELTQAQLDYVAKTIRQFYGC